MTVRIKDADVKARRIYDEWQPPLSLREGSMTDLRDQGVQMDALDELDRAQAVGSDAALAGWARRWANPALAALTGRNL